MRKIVLFSLLSAIGIGNADAVRIHGRIITAEDREPAIDATIQPYSSKDEILPGGQAADSDGRFDFNISDNAKKVQISYIGMHTQTFSPGELNGKTISLETNPTLLGGVTVIGTRTSSSGGDGCDNEANDRITPELALCSVHAYNIGVAENPSGANKQLMKEVVAL
ncbi:MAG: hypothetical protein K2I81_00340, partial [Alphaproteobacteria bacterium]|nr:hypothetical protein [Alphaproteobacteria bacterium]